MKSCLSADRDYSKQQTWPTNPSRGEAKSKRKPFIRDETVKPFIQASVITLAYNHFTPPGFKPGCVKLFDYNETKPIA